MKKLLFSLMVTTGLSSVNLIAQTTTWDIADTNKFPATITTPYTVDGVLTFQGTSGSTFAVTSNSITFSDSFAGTRRFQFGGNSYSGSTSPAVGDTSLPTKKWVELAVSKDATIKIWGRGGGARNILISDNKGKVLNSTAFADSSSTAVISYHYTGDETTLLISTGVGDNYIYKLEYTNNATLAVNDIKSSIKANAFSSGNKIYVTNLESKNTDINVYSTNGQLVKSMKSNIDTSFEINNKGIFIVNLKSEAGEKSTKVLIK